MKRRTILIFMAVLLLIAQMPVMAQSDEQKMLEITKSQAVNQSVCETETEISRTPSSSVATDENDELQFVMEYVDSIQYFDAAAIDNLSLEQKSVRDLIMQCLVNVDESVNIYDYKLEPDEVLAIMQDLIYSEPMLFHTNSGYDYSWDGTYVYDVYPKYKMTENEYTEAKTLVEEELDAILQNSGALSVEDDFLQALLLNDYIAAHYEYDLTYSYYDIYSMLTKKTAVCQGYTLLYDELLTRCGIEVGYAQSDEMNHIWNLVKIGDDYYHVDVTWNDPTSDKYGRAKHSYFLLSDEYIATEGPGSAHYNWTASDGIICDSTLYDSNILTTSLSPFVLCGEDIYYINDESGDICRYIDAKTEGTVVYTIDSIWRVAGEPGSYYQGTFSGLAAFEGKLYFNTPDSVGAYDVKEKTVEWIVTVEEDAGDIVGLRYIGNRGIEYGLAEDAAAKELSDKVVYQIPELPAFHPCDVDKDGVLNITDVNCLLTYLAGIDEELSWNVDVNNDNVINIDDLNTVLIALSTVE